MLPSSPDHAAGSELSVATGTIGSIATDSSEQMPARHCQLDDIGSASVEAVEAGGRLVAQNSIRPETAERDLLALLERVGCSDDCIHTGRRLDEQVSLDRGPQLRPGHLQLGQLAQGDHTVLASSDGQCDGDA